MPGLININGVITTPEEAKISVLDHGLLFGDSVYETLRTYGGKPFLFSRHYARLEHSAAAIHLKLPWTKSKTFEEIRRTCLAGECRIRLLITRGVVLTLARDMGLQVEEGIFDASQIERADEMFLTSTTREVVPIARVNDAAVGSGKPGPVTVALLRAYRSAVERLSRED